MNRTKAVYQNNSDVVQIIRVDDEPIRVIPGGRVDDYTDGVASKSRVFSRVPGVEPAHYVTSEEDIQYPVYAAGGKWTLSNGVVTKGGTSREDAEALEAALHAPAQTAPQGATE